MPMLDSTITNALNLLDICSKMFSITKLLSYSIHSPSITRQNQDNRSGLAPKDLPFLSSLILLMTSMLTSFSLLPTFLHSFSEFLTVQIVSISKMLPALSKSRTLHPKRPLSRLMTKTRLKKRWKMMNP